MIIRLPYGWPAWGAGLQGEGLNCATCGNLQPAHIDHHNHHHDYHYWIWFWLWLCLWLWLNHYWYDHDYDEKGTGEKSNKTRGGFDCATCGNSQAKHTKIDDHNYHNDDHNMIVIVAMMQMETFPCVCLALISNTYNLSVSEGGGSKRGACKVS